MAVEVGLERDGSTVASAEVHTLEGLEPLGSGPITLTGTLHAGTSISGSFPLIAFPSERVVAHEPTVLRRGWIYVVEPKARARQPG